MAETFVDRVDVTVRNAKEPIISIDAAAGMIIIRDAAGDQMIDLGSNGNVEVGGAGHDGDLHVNRSTGDQTAHLSGQGNLRLGGNGTDGDLGLFRTDAANSDALAKATVHADGQSGNLMLGGNGADGDLVLFRSAASDNNNWRQASVHIDGEQANLMMGGNGADGDVALFPSTATDPHDWSQATIRLDGNTGDIRVAGADCAERFDVADQSGLEPGVVLVVGENEELTPSSVAYDTRVLGVVSGAGGYRPGLILDSDDEQGRAPVALMGKVFCKVDASEHPIRVGDMLTTSDRRGFAMKAADPTRACGAVLGKALRGLASGNGLIPVLVALQ